MLETTTRECIGKTISNVVYDGSTESQCKSMYLEFSDGTQMAVGYTSDGSLCSCMVPNVQDHPVAKNEQPVSERQTGDSGASNGSPDLPKSDFCIVTQNGEPAEHSGPPHENHQGNDGVSVF